MKKQLLFAATGLFVSSALTVHTSAYNEYNCSDFSTQEEAQSEYDSDYSDPNYLDGDDDGVACESLPSESYESGVDSSSYIDAGDYSSSYDESDDYSSGSASLSSSDNDGSGDSDESTTDESGWGDLAILGVLFGIPFIIGGAASLWEKTKDFINNG
jgi:hypothetical protein